MEVVPEHVAPRKSNHKLWQVWPGGHFFCCDGRIMVGPDIGVTIFAFVLTTGASIAFWVLVCPALPLAATVVGVVLYVQTIWFLVACATTDPGIVPWNPNISDAEAEACATMQRFVDVNGVQVRLKWCRTCRIFRPPRAAHCSECNVCVERFDHHW
jgi:palmitoyltransferase ZDHHC9/14/18